MKLVMTRVYLQLINETIKAIPGASMDGWSAITPDYGESDILVDAELQVENEFVAGAVHHEYGRRLYNQTRMQA